MKKSTVLHHGGTLLPPLKLLYLNRGQHPGPHQTPVHQHPHFQIEMIFDGRATVWTPQLSLEIKTGQAALIPPHTTHRLDYPEGGCRYISAKYQIILANSFPWPGPARLTPLPFGAPLAHLMDLASQNEEARSGPGALVAAGVVAVLHGLFQEAQRAPVPSDLQERVRALVRRAGGLPVSIPEVAAALGRSPGHLTTVFRKTYGHTLKQAVDRERRLLVKKSLRYSEDNATQVAKDLGFPDILSFSHYCHRHLGEGPRALRKSFKS